MKAIGKLMAVVTLAFGIGATLPANADTAAFSFAAASNANSALGTSGLQFTPTVDIMVTSLGYYDGGSPTNGFPPGHDVGIYNFSSQALLTGAVSIDGTDPLVGNFRYEAITPLLLTAGTSYVVAGVDQATSGNTNVWFSGGPAGLTVASGITYQGYLYNNNGSLSFPALTDYYAQPFFGPNFQFAAAIPEPDTYAMMLAGLGLMGFIARRKKQKEAA